jgi:hypothetical protein
MRFLLTLAALACSPAYAQLDLSGEWASRYTWDYLECLPGPELGDYLGLPINNAARLKANSWEASTQTIPERQCIPHGADYLFSRAGFPMRIWAEDDPVTGEGDCDSHSELCLGRGANHLDGRPPASVKIRAPYLARLLHRRMEGQRPHCHHDASQVELHPA